MFEITPYNKIALTKGDTATFSVSMVKDDGKDYKPLTRDRLTLSVKGDNGVIIVKDAELIGDTFTFVLTPSDTAELNADLYEYDIQLTTAAGNVYTIIKPSIFEICEEITI